MDEQGNVLQNECVENCELPDCSDFHDTEEEDEAEAGTGGAQSLAPELDELCALDELDDDLEWLDELCEQEFEEFNL